MLYFGIANEIKKNKTKQNIQNFLLVPSVGFSVAGLDRAKLGVYQFQGFFFIVVIIISILLKPIFGQISIYSQSLVKIL